MSSSNVNVAQTLQEYLSSEQDILLPSTCSLGRIVQDPTLLVRDLQNDVVKGFSVSCVPSFTNSVISQWFLYMSLPAICHLHNSRKRNIFHPHQFHLLNLVHIESLCMYFPREEGIAVFTTSEISTSSFCLAIWN